ncbi:MAG: GNAT family N-acetyltransferase [bacterium]|nr:GNAT family N-acetyltransferase [bacterium]
MQTAVFSDETVFDQLRDEWNPLVERSISNTIFLTWEWQTTWWRAYQAGQLCVVTCRDDAGRLVGIGSWFIHLLDGERVLRTIGCVDVTDYMDIIADREHLDTVQAAFAQCLREYAAAYDRINLCNIPEESPTLAHFPQHLNGCGFTAEKALQEVCPIIRLPTEWEAYLESLDKKQRHELRRKLRRMDDVEYEHRLITGGDDLNTAADQFLDLMRASHPQKAHFLEDPQNVAFFRAMIPVMAAKGWLRLSFLIVEGTAAAAYCDFDYNGHILVYNSGLLPEAHAQLSPGIVLLSLNIQAAIAQRRTVYDFLRGNETYKYRMGAQDTQVFMLKAHLRERQPAEIDHTPL